MEDIIATILWRGTYSRWNAWWDKCYIHWHSFINHSHKKFEEDFFCSLYIYSSPICGKPPLRNTKYNVPIKYWKANLCDSICSNYMIGLLMFDTFNTCNEKSEACSSLQMFMIQSGCINLLCDHQISVLISSDCMISITKFIIAKWM